jgi:chemotaxis protein MotB
MDDDVFQDEESGNSWLITFSDLMSILFALFVLINSFSEVDVDSFKRNAGPIAQAFNKDTPEFKIKVVKKAKEKIIETKQLPKYNVRSVAKTIPNDNEYLALANKIRTTNLVKTYLGEEIRNKVLSISYGKKYLTISLPSDSTFKSGSDYIRQKIFPVLSKISTLLEQTVGPILISGHTDSDPIKNEKFRSNWDLSAERAVSIAHKLLESENIDRKRIIVRGHADTKNISSNYSFKGKSLNRRVEIWITVQNTIAHQLLNK